MSDLESAPELKRLTVLLVSEVGDAAEDIAAMPLNSAEPWMSIIKGRMSEAYRLGENAGLEKAAHWLENDEENMLDWTDDMRSFANFFARPIRSLKGQG